MRSSKKSQKINDKDNASNEKRAVSSPANPSGTILRHRRKRMKRKSRSNHQHDSESEQIRDEFEFRVAYSSTEFRWLNESDAQISIPKSVCEFWEAVGGRARHARNPSEPLRIRSMQPSWDRSGKFSFMFKVEMLGERVPRILHPTQLSRIMQERFWVGIEASTRMDRVSVLLNLKEKAYKQLRDRHHRQATGSLIHQRSNNAGLLPNRLSQDRSMNSAAQVIIKVESDEELSTTESHIKLESTEQVKPWQHYTFCLPLESDGRQGRDAAL